jgi:long-chain acyl-CoA synthetase
MDASNLSAMHRSVAEQLGSKPALYYRQDGVYRSLSWADYRRISDRAAAGLIRQGIQPGDRIGLLAENSAEWRLADIAILATGAVSVPIHASSTAAQVEYLLRHSGARSVVVSDQGQADKVLERFDALPDLQLLIAIGTVDVGGRVDHTSWEGLVHACGPSKGSSLSRVLDREGSLGRNDLATIIYTSGTTGEPKGAMLTHGNVLSNAEATFEHDPPVPCDVLLSWLPHSHIFARTVDHFLTVLAGVTVYLAQSPETLLRDLAEVQPTLLTAVPRFYQKVWLRIERRPPEGRAAALAQVFGPRIRRISSGGAPLPKYLAQEFAAAGLPISEGYGMSETSPVISFNTPAHHKIGSVGTVIPRVEVSIAGDGEILTRGPCLMKGYWRDEAATRAAIDHGWMHTGDVGTLDGDGFLFITGRKKDLIVTTGGKKIAPSELEHMLARDELIDEAVACGDGRPFAVALIVPNHERLERALAPGHGPLHVVGDLIEDEPAHDLLRGRIDRIMQAVSRSERVRDFLLLARPFQLDSGEITSTLVVRRRHVLEKYRESIDALYERHSKA